MIDNSQKSAFVQMTIELMFEKSLNTACLNIARVSLLMNGDAVVLVATSP